MHQLSPYTAYWVTKDQTSKQDDKIHNGWGYKSKREQILEICLVIKIWC